MARTPKAGDYIEAITTDETIKGILLESPEIQKDTVLIKLDSGYNIGIDKSKIKKISALQQTKKEAATAIPPKEKQSNLPKITILHTGGTIASKVDYRTGGVVSRFKPEEIVAMFPEIRQIAQVDSRLIGNMFSEDMRFAHYNIMAKEIQKEAAKGTSGIIITHGT
ncbi:asparaginase, partial [Candidatus Woesearchaeota archaeon]|nr:asparaginase [Candidatus Woesearchaeota archaeon]